MIYRCTLVLISLLFLQPAVNSGSVSAQVPVLIEDELFVEDAKQAIDSLYNRNEDAAERVMKPWMDNYPDHPLWHLWNAMELWWKVLEDLPDDQYDEEFFNLMKLADYEAGRLLRKQPDHPDALIIASVANAYAARHHSNRENWITSMNLGRRAFQAHGRLLEVRPNLPDNEFAEGLKRYYSAYIPDNYPVVRAISWFLPEGDKQGGILSLQKASKNGVFARPEAAYFLGYILLNYEEDYEEASEIFETLVNSYPENGYYRRLHIRALVQMKRYEEAKGAAQIVLNNRSESNRDTDSDRVLLEEVLHWLGRSHYHTGSYQDAAEAFEKSYEAGLHLPNLKQREFHTLSAYFAGRVHELMSNSQGAIMYYQAALEQSAGDQAKQSAKERLDRLM